MANLTDVINGSKIIVQIEQTLDIGDYTPMVGETSHTNGRAVALIDISNKSNPNARCNMAGEGTRTSDLSIESINNSAAVVDILWAAFDATQLVRLRTIEGTRTETGQYFISAASTNPSLNTAVSTSFTLVSDGLIMVT